MGTKIKCLKCGDIIESKYRHNFISCSCGACFVDGGNDYCRVGGNFEDMRFIDENGKEVEILTPIPTQREDVKKNES